MNPTDELSKKKKQLLDIIKKESVFTGEFTLSSGKKSNYYIDMRRTTLHPLGARLIGEIIFDMIKDMDIDCIGGPTMGADPIVSGVSIASSAVSEKQTASSIGKYLPGFYVRKEAKSHGTMKIIEGIFKPGNRVVIVEDVVTTGASTLKTIKAVKTEGGKVVRVIALVDREEGGKESIQKEGYEFESIFQKSEIL